MHIESNGTAEIYPTRRFTLVGLNAGFAPDARRSHDDEGAPGSS